MNCTEVEQTAPSKVMTTPSELTARAVPMVPATWLGVSVRVRVRVINPSPSPNPNLTLTLTLTLTLILT